MHSGAEPAHGIAKNRRLDRLHRLGPDGGKRAVHCIVGPLVNPTHRCAPADFACSMF
jgi:hypothetical protein